MTIFENLGNYLYIKTILITKDIFGELINIFFFVGTSLTNGSNFFLYQNYFDNLTIVDSDIIFIVCVISVFFFLFGNIFFFSFQYYLVGKGRALKHNLEDSIKNIFIDGPLHIFFRRIYGIDSHIDFMADNVLCALIMSLFISIYFYFYVGDGSLFVFESDIKYNKPLIGVFDITSVNYFSQININYNVIGWISFFFSDFASIGFLLDPLSLLMAIIVLSISTFVHYYSIEYMSTDPRLIVFIKYLSGFTVAMLILIFANNMILMFLGWEGVGIYSYLLIGFWYTGTLALKASLKAVIVNGIGDVSLLIAFSLCLFFFGTTDFNRLLNITLFLNNHNFFEISLGFEIFNISIISLISFFLLIGAIGKSAQFGLHTWLPDAMEGPTPVSALIHAATMVTAGVYLLVGCSFLLEQTTSIGILIILIGGFTALFGSIIACFQYDIKKIIAFSTCSQIGYMFLACGFSAYNIAMFHLFTHAFFKALLFLCAGSIIHSISDEQDIGGMGGLYKLMPITFTGIIIGLFSLMGFPFSAGFYSKDSIIEIAFSKATLIGYYGFICAALAAFCTAFYCYRFLFYVFFSKSKISRKNLMNLGEIHLYDEMLCVIFCLSLITIFIGFFFKQPFSSPFSFIYYFNSLIVIPDNFIFSNYEYFLFSFSLIKILIFLIPIVSFIISFILYEIGIFESFFIFFLLNTYNKRIMGTFYIFYCLQSKGLIDYIYNLFFIKSVLNISYGIAYVELDGGWFEFIFIIFPTKFCFFFSKIFNGFFKNLKIVFTPTFYYLISFFVTVIIFFFNVLI